MKEPEDIKLKALLHEMKLDSPDENFTVKVMNKIFEDQSVFENIRKEKLLGKGFWIIIFLFGVLFITMFIYSGPGLPSDGQIMQLFPELNGGVSAGYQSVFNKIGAVPLSIAGILFASSILLFVDRFLTAKSKLSKHH